MPIIARLDGVTIVMHSNDHQPAHFHAVIAEHRASINIDTLEIDKGTLPIPKYRLVKRWAASRRAELKTAWQTCRAGRIPELIK